MTGILRNPTAQVIALGPFVFDEVEVTLSRTKDGDKFTAKGPISANNIAGFVSAATIPVTVSFNGTQLFSGNVDHSDYDFDEGTITISGRDKGAALIDAQTSEKHLNKKPSDIVNTYAQRHGLQADVDTPTDDAGKIYSSDYDAITHRGSEWSHIASLADEYGMVTYITGGTLFFKQEPEQLPNYQINYTPPTPAQYASGNFIKLKCSRNHVLGRPIKVNAHSHHHRSKQINTATQQSSGNGGEPLIYNSTHPLMSTEQLNRIATKRLAEIQAHELKMESLDIPGDETVNARMTFVLSGTGTALDTSYDGETIHHKMSFKDGFRTTIDCKTKKKGS